MCVLPSEMWEGGEGGGRGGEGGEGARLTARLKQ